MFKTYDKEIGALLLQNSKEIDWTKQLQLHRLMITRIQHERLMHLLVMLFVGLMMALAVFSVMFWPTYPIFALVIILTILFVAYVIHYRFLENTTQKWYEIEDTLIKKCE